MSAGGIGLRSKAEVGLASFAFYICRLDDRPPFVHVGFLDCSKGLWALLLAGQNLRSRSRSITPPVFPWLEIGRLRRGCRRIRAQELWMFGAKCLRPRT